MNAPAAPLARLLLHTADTVLAVQRGRSLSDLLPALAADLRPGVMALAFHVLRRLGSATEVRTRLAPKTPPPPVDSLLLTALALAWPPTAGERAPYPDHTLVNEAVHAARQRVPAAAPFINAVLRRFLRERASWVAAAGQTPEGAYNHPAWWVRRLRAEWPDRWQALLDAANRHPPMTLRVNARRTDAARYGERLAAAGIPARIPSPWPLPVQPAEAVLLQEPRPVAQLPGFAEGDVSVQDAAAQIAAPLLIEGLRARAAGAAPPRVLDACAAPGGKTAHLLEKAALDLVALDVDAARLDRVRENLRRLGLQATLARGDAGEPASWWDGRPFDAILLDAPCTASGIVRRHPDVRWLRRESDISALARTQARLLDALWPLLAPGGRLVYATCSIFKSEGTDQIDAFLQRRGPDAARLLGQSPGHLLPLADNSGPGAHGVDEPPATALHDGFFYALIEKT